MPQVTRTDIHSKIKELVDLIIKFQGWDDQIDNPIASGKMATLDAEQKCCVMVFGSMMNREIKIIFRE